jgi:predicted amino acid dehydrogenase
MKSTYRIAEISYGLPFRDKSYTFQYGECKFEVQTYGANFKTDYVQALIKNFRNDVDAFALTSLPPMMRLEGKNYIPKAYFEIMNTPTNVPVCDGSYLRELLNLRGLMDLVEKREIQLEDGILFPAAILNLELEEFIRKKAGFSKVVFADLFSLFGIPVFLKPFLGLKTLAKVAFTLANLRDLSPSNLRNSLTTKKLGLNLNQSVDADYRYIIGDLNLLNFAHNLWPFYKDKEVITWTHDEQQERRLYELGVKKIIQLIPPKYLDSRCMNYSVMDAAYRLTRGRFSSLSVAEWEQELQIPPEKASDLRPFFVADKPSLSMKVTKGIAQAKQQILKKDPIDFAFVVHALSHRDLLRIPGAGIFKHLPRKHEFTFDKVIGKLPGFAYGRVQHVISAHDGREINGLIYGLSATPRVLRESDPQEVYRKIESLAFDAYNQGAKILGLGAYTKIVGDNGITINQNSPIPVTTGNSLSASSTLWALHDALKKMNLLELNTANGLIRGNAMVIGATGSIGKVSAKLISLVMDRLYLVAPRLERLEELKLEIAKISPQCQVIVGTDANEFAADIDALVTATSAFDQKIVDVMKLKPGCVVCDCSRPLDFTAEDARKRPDVLIIESGEVVLPGPYEVTCDIGLHGNIVYACLAETAILAMEQKYEPFTLGRDIDWEKVKVIYKLALKHGVKLASIQGHWGEISDKEIEIVRNFALKQRGGI